MQRRPGGVTFANLVSVLTRQPGAFVAWVIGLIDVVVLVGLWGTPGATEFFRSASTPPPCPVPPVSPPLRL